MSNEPYSVTTSQSWGGRLMESIKGVLAGGAIFIAAFPVLWINEGCAVKIAKGLKEGAANVVEVDVSKFSAEHEGKLIHGTGQATTPENLRDGVFGINMNAIKLNRNVEMYQWKENAKSETKEKLGGGKETTTTYTYEKTWSSSLIDSGSFNDPKARTNYVNPKVMAFKNENWTANNVKVGDYKISGGLIGQISASEKVDYTKVSVPASISSRSKVQADQIYIGDPNSPKVGDYKISHTIALPQEVSILGQVKSGVVGAFKTSQDTTIERLQKGKHTAEEMFAAAQSENVMRTWIVRIVGFFMFFGGLSLILKPISTLGAVVPFLGNLLGFGLNLVSGLISFILTFLVIAIAWIFYRPILGIALLAIAGGALFFLWKKKQEADAKAAADGATPGTPPNPQVG
jgi:hypothetical protein